MRARARLAVARDSSRASNPTRITALRSDPPLVLRPTIPTTREPLLRWNLHDRTTARVALTAAAAGPLGGDHLRLDVDVGDGATLVLRGVAATLLLPGPHREPSCTDNTINVGTDATFVWLPGAVIAASGCDHRQTTRVILAPGARLLIQDVLVLGRHGEPTGSVRQRLRVCVGEHPLYDQELRIGPSATGSSGPAVTGGRRAIGSILIVDPDHADADVFTQSSVTADGTSARLPLSGGATLITALAPDLIGLGHRLTTSLAALEAARS